MSRKLRIIFGAVGLGVLLQGASSLVFAQTEATTGVIVGTVRDQTGAVLPRVTLQLKHLGTGLVRQATTGDNGYYRAALLPLGGYTITASLQGFATLNRTGIQVGVGQELVVDLEMQLAAVGAVVNVNEEAPVVETTRFERSQVINPRSISDLPINGRDFTDLVLLTPTATVTSTTQGKRIAVGGGSEVTTGIFVDGADYKSPFRGFQTGATAPFILSQEAVQEFEVVRAGFSAEFGRSQGGRINVVTKSGTNQFHGSAFYFFRDSALAADDALGRTLSFRNQQFGGSLGGPFHKDRLFFFTAYDQQKSSVPLFAVLPDSLVQAADQVIPELKLGEQRGRYQATNDGINWFWKMDYLISSSHQISGRFNLLSAEAQNVFNDPNRAIGAQRAQANDVQNAILSYNVVRGNKLNEFRFQFSHDSQPVLRQPLGTDFPTATVLVAGQNYTIGGTESDIDPFLQARQQYTDNFSYNAGRHYLKFGGDVNTTSLDEFFASNARGLFRFQSLNDFLARRASNFTQFVPLRGLTLRQAGTVAFRTREFALYAQDKFRVARNLTLDIGLRWEAQWNQDAVTNPDFPASGPIPDNLKNFAPRLGISWDPFRKGTTVIRLGGGLFYARTDGIAVVRTFDTNGTSGARVSLTPTGPGGNLIPLFPQKFANFSLLPPSAIPPLDITFVASNFAPPRSVQWTAGLEHQLVRNLSVSVDFEISNTVHGNLFRNLNLFPATRIAADGRPVYDRTQRPFPRFNRLQIIEGSARAGYHGVVLAVQKRYSRRFQLQASYTYAHQRDNSGDSFNRVQGITVQDSFNTSHDFGFSNPDVRHRFVLSSILDLPLGFSLSQIVNWQTGIPFNGLLATDANNDGVFTDRPYVNGVTLPLNTFRQPRFFNWNLRILKRFALPNEKKQAELSLEFFNLTNASNFTTTNTTVGTATFGRPNVPGPPFQMQLGARYKF